MSKYRRYQVVKDLPGMKPGDILYLEDNGEYYCSTDKKNRFSVDQCEKSDWFMPYNDLYNIVSGEYSRMGGFKKLNQEEINICNNALNGQMVHFDVIERWLDTTFGNQDGEIYQKIIESFNKIKYTSDIKNLMR